MKNIGGKRLLAALLVFVTVLALVPGFAFAEDGTADCVGADVENYASQPADSEQTAQDGAEEGGDDRGDSDDTGSGTNSGDSGENTDDTGSDTDSGGEKNTEEEPAGEESAEEESVEEADEDKLAELQEKIKAFPTVDELRLMTYEKQLEIYEAVQDAYDVYDALTAEEQEQITGADKFEVLFEYFSGLTDETDDTGVKSETDFLNAFTGDSNVIKLGADLTVSGSVTISEGEYTLDLNGHTLTAQGINSLINVTTGGSLTVMDSANEIGTGTEKIYYRVLNVYSENSATGATEVDDKNMGRTFTAFGRIIGGSAPVVSLTGGEFILAGGTLSNGTGRAVDMTGGTVNLNGGCISGFTQSGGINVGSEHFGGAIRATGGTLNLSGTVLANNSALNGGAIYASSATVNMTGGVISNNEANRKAGAWNNHSENAAYRCGGGGIYCDGNTTLVMSGGYITCNKATDNGYFDGGGGVFISGRSCFTLNGGYITGNTAYGGGAGVRTDWNKSTTFTMNGGYVCGNDAGVAEGGGIAITRGGTGIISGGYINNNLTEDENNWGGGGVFCSDGASLQIYNALITQNRAGGFGGGVAGCSTGRIFLCANEGGAIYNNAAAGTNLSGSSSQKNADHTYAASSAVFMENGYADYFCAMSSIVAGSMLGGGSANWSGSVDGEAVKNVAGDATLEASYVMGLTANPGDDAKSTAQREANVYINGNYAPTHGGGVLCNGYLLIGNTDSISVGSRLALNGTKILTGKSTDLSGYTFRFELKDEQGKLVSLGSSDEDGNISFDRLLSFTEKLCSESITETGGTHDYVYYLTEAELEEYPEIEFDDSRYKIIVTIRREDSTISIANKVIKESSYNITDVKVEKSTDGGQNWSSIASTYSTSDDEQHGKILKITDEATFTNKAVGVTSFTVKKAWEGADSHSDSVTVDLLQDGTVYKTVILSADNNWTYTWEKLPKGDHTYTVAEHSVPGYSSSVTYGNGWEAGWYPADTIEVGGEYLLVSQSQYALTGSPTKNSYYDFSADNWKIVSVTDGYISNDNVTDDMKWSAVTIDGKVGVYLKNSPSDGKHYLSYQGTDTVKASSSNTDYASQLAADCSGGLKLYYYKDTSKIAYVIRKDGGTVKADETAGTNGFYLYEYVADSGISAEITNTYTPTPTPTPTPPSTPKPTEEPKTVSVSVSKVWSDNSNKEGKRPGSVTVQLYKDGKAYGDAVMLSASSSWTYVWKDLKADSEYTVKETNIPQDYYALTKQDGNVVTITNCYGVKTGDDANLPLWTTLAALSLLGLAAAGVITKRKRPRGTPAAK